MSKFKDLFEFVEHWASVYKPMLHSPETNERFFLTESHFGLIDFMKTIDESTDQPCVIMESMVDGTISNFNPQRRLQSLDITSYTIYFFVCAEQQGEGRATQHAMAEAKFHALNFLRYLHRFQNTLPHTDPFFGIDTEVQLRPVGPLYNHWYAYYITLDMADPLNKCVDESLYYNDEPWDETSV